MLVFCLYLDELVFPCADADFLAVLQTAAPVGVRMDALEVVVVVLVDVTRLPVGGGAAQGRLGVHRVDTGHVQRHGIEGGEHTHIGHDGHVVLAAAVAVGGHVDDQRDVEAGPAVHHRLGVLGDLVVEIGGALVPVDLHGVLRTDGDAASAAHALVVVDVRLAVFDDGCAVGADLGAGPAADALFFSRTESFCSSCSYRAITSARIVTRSFSLDSISIRLRVPSIVTRSSSAHSV